MINLKNIKIILINFFIFLILLLLVETISYAGRKVLKKDDVGWLVKKLGQRLEVLGDDCLRFRTHPFYSHTHDHKNQCDKILNGKTEGPFVVYNNNINPGKAILVLGGSATDGLFYKFANKKTWPYYLNEKLIQNNLNDYRVYNGGVGGYSSSQELLKLIIDGQRIKEDVKYVISFNGSNDMPGYTGTREYENLLPYWTEVSLSMFSDGKWVRQSSSNISKFLPSTISLITFLKKKIMTNNEKFEVKQLQDVEKKGKNSTFKNKEKMKDWEKAILMNKSQNISSDELWLRNVKLMKTISNSLGAEYYVFIQPSLGITDSQLPEKNTDDYKLYEKIDQKVFLPNFKEYLNKIIIKCEQLSYCYNMYKEITPVGDLYYDPRHHNEKGNYKIADYIFNSIFLN
jgi:hypothetical protein